MGYLMDARRPRKMRIVGRWILGFGLVALGAFGSTARAQGPQVDIDSPPGSPNARGSLGPALGASGTSGFDGTPVQSIQSVFGGRAGPQGTRVPLNELNPPRTPVTPMVSPFPRPTVLEPENLPKYGNLELPLQEEEEGPADGLTLDAAIERMIHSNLSLTALKFELPMAEADVLTAGLRNNPIFYADSQLVPYGHYSNQRPGGDTQYDVNVTQQIDIWRKRKARMIVAQRAKKVTEAQFQDAVRQQIDNLYTAYVDAVAAKLTVRFSRKYAEGLRELLVLNRQLQSTGFIKPADVLVLRARLELAELQIREATQTQAKTLRTLGLLLNISPMEADKLQLRGTIYDTAPLPATPDALIETGLNARPDLLAYKMGLLRANADVVFARSQRFSDVYLLYQPYTMQNNNWQGLKNAYSWTVGATVTMPVFNRNQGNILRSKLNAEQSKYELANQEKQVVYDVAEAIREFELSRHSVIEYRKEVIPASREVRNSAFRRWQGGETSALDYLEAQQDYNDVIRQYRDALVRHRRAMLDLNTAVGSRVVP